MLEALDYDIELRYVKKEKNKNSTMTYETPLTTAEVMKDIFLALNDMLGRVN